jgi:uroporphyrinogen decarboxylase
MNGYERINAALKGLQPDKTPIMLHNFMMAAREKGFTMDQYRNNSKIIADTFIASIEKYHYDGILVDLDTATLAGAVGVQVDFPPDDPARAHLGNLENLENANCLSPVRVEDYRRVQIWLEAVRLLKEYFQDELFIRGNCDQAPFSLASMIRGTQNWMLDLMMGFDDQIEVLLEYCTDVCSQFIRLMAQTGCDMVSSGDSPAGPEMISPEMYFKYAMPYEKRLVDVAHKEKLPYALHICGNTDLILDKMLLTGADAFELDYKTDVVRAYDVFHHSATLGTTDEVRKKTRELLNTYRSNRFILNAGCAIPPNTPPENLKEMIETAREFRAR